MTSKEDEGDLEGSESSDAGQETEDAVETSRDISSLDDQASTELEVEKATDETNSPEQVSGDNSDSAEKTAEEDPATSKLYPCKDCNYTTHRKYAYLTHWVRHLMPDGKGMYRCLECSYSSTLRFNLKTHLKRHANINELEEGELFRCSEKDCTYTTMHKSDMATHAKKHNPDKRFRCLDCDFTSIYRHSLLHHVSSKHQGVRPHQCSLCSYSAARKQDLETHVWIHSGEKKFKCSMCKYETPYKHSLEAHMNKHKGIKPFQCSEPDCEYSTTTKANLKSHMKRHERQCKGCDFKVLDGEDMANHHCPGEKETKKRRTVSPKKKLPQGVENEAGVVEYACEHCQFKTAHKRSLQQHGRRHEPGREAPSKRYMCEHCAYETGYKSSLKRHLARHSAVKPLKCGHCDYSAINMSQMHLHIAKHTGIKPYKCNVCSYESANKQHLVMHMSKHSDIRYTCDICGFTTAWPPRMTAHAKLHAQGKVIFPPWRRSTKQTAPLQLQLHSSVSMTTANPTVSTSSTVTNLPVLFVVPENGESFQMVNFGDSGGAEVEGETIIIHQNFEGADGMVPVENIIVQPEDQGPSTTQHSTDVTDSALVIVTNAIQEQMGSSSEEPQASEQCPESAIQMEVDQVPAPTPIDGTSQISLDVIQNAT